jgi:hypothetical protein
VSPQVVIDGDGLGLQQFAMRQQYPQLLWHSSMVQDIRRKITDLSKLKPVMETMVSRCYGVKMPKCPIVDEFFNVRAPVSPAKPARSARRVMPL